MTPTLSHIEPYRRSFEQILRQADPESRTLRSDAFDHFSRKGFPSIEQEDWRFTSLAALTDHNFLPVNNLVPSAVQAEDIKPLLFSGWSGCQLVFIDGSFNAGLSSLPSGQSGIEFFADAASGAMPGFNVSANHKDIITENAFSALNAAFFSDSAQLRISDQADPELPLHICFIATRPDELHMSHPRLLVEIGAHARFTLVESYLGFSDNCYFTNAFTQIRLDENAQLIHYRLQNESLKAFHISNTNILQSRNSRYNSVSVNLGGALARNNLNYRLDGEGISTVLNGLYMARGRQHIDNQTFIDHARPHCESHELYQGIITDEARGVFTGKILVRPDAQKTDAKQSNNCLLLSEAARINSKPQLEIYADDVKCTHGATVGHLDLEQIFYLQSRGISRPRARNMLTYAFAERVIERIRIPQVREHIDRLLAERFGGDLKL